MDAREMRIRGVADNLIGGITYAQALSGHNIESNYWKRLNGLVAQVQELRDLALTPPAAQGDGENGKEG